MAELRVVISIHFGLFSIILDICMSLDYYVSGINRRGMAMSILLYSVVAVRVSRGQYSCGHSIITKCCSIVLAG